MRLVPKMVVSKRLGRKWRGEKGCPTISEGGWGVVVRFGVEIVYVEIFCWTGFWGWGGILKWFWGRGLGRWGPAEMVFLTGVTV